MSDTAADEGGGLPHDLGVVTADTIASLSSGVVVGFLVIGPICQHLSNRTLTCVERRGE